MSDRTKQLLAVQRALPIDSDLARARFVKFNLHWRGAEWADILDMLIDSDSHLDVVEPIGEVLSYLPDDAKPYVEMVALTLLYAWGEDRLPSPFDVAGKVETVLGYVEAHS